MERISVLLRLEALKQKKRFNFLILLAGLLTVNIWIWKIADRYSSSWAALIYELFMENSTTIPMIIAVYASRQMDFEHKGDTWKLLYTFASPYEIFFTKIIRGSIQIFAAILIETAGVLVTGIHFGYPDEIPMVYFAWTFFCNFLVTEILFLLQSLLSFFIPHQAFSFCTGLAGFFISLFLMFFKSEIICRILPWGLYGNTMPVIMDWNKETRAVRFFYMAFSFFDVFVCVLWIAGLIALACILLRHGNTDEKSSGSILSLIHPQKHNIEKHKTEQTAIQKPEQTSYQNIKHKSKTPHRIPTELLKMRQLPPWLSLIILPCMSAFMGTFNYLGNQEVLTQDWYSLWSQHTLFLNYFFMPIIIGIFASSIWHVEHTGANWNQLLANASAAKIVIQKYLTMLFFNALTILWTTILFIFCGKLICGFLDMPPKVIIEWTLCGLLGMATVSGMHLFISLIIRSFAIPIGISFIGSASGITVTAFFKILYVLPYTLLAVGMRSNNSNYVLNYPVFFTSCGIQIILWIALAVFYIDHTDVRTDES